MPNSKENLQEHKVGFIFRFGTVDSAEIKTLTPRGVCLFEAYRRTENSIRNELLKHHLFSPRTPQSARYAICDKETGFVEGETAAYAIWLTRPEEIPPHEYHELFKIVKRHLSQSSAAAEFFVCLQNTPQKRIYQTGEDVSVYPWWSLLAPALRDSEKYSQLQHLLVDALTSVEQMESICSEVAGTVGSWDTEELNGIASDALALLKTLQPGNSRVAELRKPLKPLRSLDVTARPDKKMAVEANDESIALVVLSSEVEEMRSVCRRIADKFQCHADERFESLAKEAQGNVEFWARANAGTASLLNLPLEMTAD